MKRKVLIFTSILIVILVSACGPAPEPTLAAGDIANTAVANAWIALTATQAAIPTATATFPPTATFTPLPTFTPIPIPTLAPATAVPTQGEDPCNLPPPTKPKGTLVKVKFVNKSGGTLNLSFGMLQPNSLGECGTYGYSLGVFDEPVVTVLAGCYWAYAWVTQLNSNKPSTAKNASALCVTDPAKEPDIWITSELIAFH
ncbi:MAG: hypothetical protein U0Z26_19330 [Anaerolineales bacterium]